MGNWLRCVSARTKPIVVRTGSSLIRSSPGICVGSTAMGVSRRVSLTGPSAKASQQGWVTPASDPNGTERQSTQVACWTSPNRRRTSTLRRARNGQPTRGCGQDVMESPQKWGDPIT
jgi:hypothetical protein